MRTDKFNIHYVLTHSAVVLNRAQRHMKQQMVAYHDVVKLAPRAANLTITLP